MRLRRSLSHVGGPTTTWGDRALAADLARALDVAPAPPPRAGGGRDVSPPTRADVRGERRAHGRIPAGTTPAGSGGGGEDSDRAHVHGFHAYPARMHPETAMRLVRLLCDAGDTVLDPFCGSGTVLVEAMLAGRHAVGTDLNPLAVRLARLKTRPFDADGRRSIVAHARAIAEWADARRLRRAGASRRYPREDVALFAPHVLLELDSLAVGIRDRVVEDASVREALELVLSAVLVKVTLASSDTSATSEPRRTASGFPARLFARKAEELARRLAAFARGIPPDVAAADVAEDDAARLRTVAASTVDAIVTSPPYAGTYDYLAHHEMRMRWLGLDPRALATHEIGARRTYAHLDASAAGATWAREIGLALRAMKRVCRSRARVALLLADSAVAGRALRADELVAATAPEAGFTVLARASQPRPHFHGPTAGAFREIPRSEHAIVLEKR